MSHPSIIRAAIERAVQMQDEAILDAIAHRMNDAAEAMQILRAKGYEGTSLPLLAKQVLPSMPET